MRIRLSLLIAGLSLGLFAGCGGDDESAEEAAPPEGAATEQTETAAAPAVDTEALRECLLTPQLDRGVYEEIRDVSPRVEEAAAAEGAELFELNRASEAFVYVFAYPDTESALAGGDAVGTALGELLAELEAGAPRSIELGGPTVEPVESLLVGFITLDSQDPEELVSSTVDDINGCLRETG